MLIPHKTPDTYWIGYRVTKKIFLLLKFKIKCGYFSLSHDTPLVFLDYRIFSTINRVGIWRHFYQVAPHDKILPFGWDCFFITHHITVLINHHNMDSSSHIISTHSFWVRNLTLLTLTIHSPRISSAIRTPFINHFKHQFSVSSILTHTHIYRERDKGERTFLIVNSISESTVSLHVHT